MNRRLVRNSQDAVLGGVAAGFGDYLDVDPVLVRLIFVLLCIAGGSGLLLYLVCWLVMPRDDRPASTASPSAEHFADEVRAAGERVAANLRRSTAEPGRGRLLAGLALIVLGFLFLVDRFTDVWWLDVWRLWPLLLVVAGVVILVRSGNDDDRETPASWSPPPHRPEESHPPARAEGDTSRAPGSSDAVGETGGPDAPDRGGAS